MCRHKKWIKGIPGLPCMPLFFHKMTGMGVAMLVLCLLASCHTDTRYHVYQAVPGENGWKNSDSLLFQLPPELEAGEYGMEIGIRHTGGYPYRDIWISVTQVDSDSLPSHTDTLHLYLADEEGRWGHEGAVGGLYQSAYVREKPVKLTADSLGRSFRIAHLMRRNPLPGISDVGVRLFLTRRINAEKHE